MRSHIVLSMFKVTKLFDSEQLGAKNVTNVSQVAAAEANVPEAPPEPGGSSGRAPSLLLTLLLLLLLRTTSPLSP